MGGILVPSLEKGALRNICEKLMHHSNTTISRSSSHQATGDHKSRPFTTATNIESRINPQKSIESHIRWEMHRAHPGRATDKTTRSSVWIATRRTRKICLLTIQCHKKVNLVRASTIKSQSVWTTTKDRSRPALKNGNPSAGATSNSNKRDDSSSRLDHPGILSDRI